MFNINVLKKSLAAISAFFIFIFILSFNESYGKYISSLDEGANIKIAKWRILLNDEDIRNISSINSVIAPVFDGNEFIKSNVIAPGAEGYFDLTINGDDTDVTFKYEIALNIASESPVQDLIITGYSINGNEKIETNDTTFEGIIAHDNENKNITIRIFIKWDDSDNASMNNIDDTEATLTNLPAKMNINLVFSQLTEESI